MAVYKVAQDVEADDKLLGPFSFRQFIYLIIVVIAGALAYGLSKIFLPLLIIPLPVILFFGALALPLRKDQPMEVYLAAVLSYYLKPRRRTWQADGVESLIEITAPKIAEVQRAKDISESEAERRLSYLADIADTGGWAIRHTAMPQSGNAMSTDAFLEAQSATDVLDTSSGVAQSFDTMITQSAERQRQEAVARMQQAVAAASQPTPVTAPAPIPPVADPYASLSQQPTQPVPATQPVANPLYNPYPTIHQSVVQPLDTEDQIVGATPVATPTPPAAAVEAPPVATPAPEPVAVPSQDSQTSTSDTPLSPDIINLANNADLSIETISREANRARKKAEADDGEVFISLH